MVNPLRTTPNQTTIALQIETGKTCR